MPDIKEAKLANLTFGHVLRFMRELAILIVVGTLLIKLLTGDLGLDFTKLSASELVSILLAFFSIALSAGFYFAATSQSNQFYDNVNNFTKDTSTLLGRLDEQVKGVSGRQSELKDSIDKYYLRGNSEKVEEAQEATEKQVQKVEGNLADIVSELFDKAKLAPDEREQFEKRIRERDIELRQLRERLGRLASRSERPVRRYTRHHIEKMGLSEAIELDPDELLFQIAKKSISGYRRDLMALGYTTTETPQSRKDITEKGIKMVASELEALVDSEDES